MRRWFLSYNSQDLALMQAFEAALRRRDADARLFFAPQSLRAGGFWLPELAQEIAEATAFILLVGEKGIGPWQAARAGGWEFEGVVSGPVAAARLQVVL